MHMHAGATSGHEPPRGEHRLGLETASRLPATSGVYAAWIVDPQLALRRTVYCPVFAAFRPGDSTSYCP
jgi:hypothetical protein